MHFQTNIPAQSAFWSWRLSLTNWVNHWSLSLSMLYDKTSCIMMYSLTLESVYYYLLKSYLISSYLMSVAVGISGRVSAFSLSLFPVSFSLFFFVSWVGEQSQGWYSEMLALTQCWYAVTAVEAGRGRSRAQRDTRGWLIETGVRTSDQTLTPQLPHETASTSVTCPHPFYRCISWFSLCFSSSFRVS